MIPSFSFVTSRTRLASSTILIVCLSCSTVLAQKADRAKLETAARRAGKAAKVLTQLSALPPGETIAKELIAKAQAIAVFPDTDKVNMLFLKMMKGYGMVSRRVPGGWSLPAYYGFAVLDRGWSKTKSGEPGIIMLFMNEDTVKRFEKDHISLEAEAGPVGELTRETGSKIRGADIIMYALSDGTLRGVSVEDDYSTQSGINSDNNVNKAVYGLKARDVLTGKTPLGPPPPHEIAEFQEELFKLSKQ